MGSFPETYNDPNFQFHFVKRWEQIVLYETKKPEEENYIDCHLEYSSVWSRIVDLEERGHVEA